MIGGNQSAKLSWKGFNTNHSATFCMRRMQMFENHRTGLLRQLMRDCAYIASGLQRVGFRGGWL